ncbi:LysR family transcriptional regulator [Dyella humicola]|uniref:LysR family transcriptional regulator n=1 Tax=Dyella humicola TaxID=2992126 RepID=UPI00225336A1|nr:LysR family transcriptional regulator [Dyella humicola]
MDRVDAMRMFLAAVDTGSFSAASRQLQISLATVSRRVAELEEHLDARLLLRGTRKLELTDAGRALVDSCRRIVEDVAEAERVAAGEFRVPQGELVISTPTVMGRTHVVPVAVDFLNAYPSISLRVQFTERKVNLLEEHVDVALRIGALPDSNLVAVPVGLIRQVLCASPAYLEHRGAPKVPEDLINHHCVTYESVYVTKDRWEFSVKGNASTIQVPSRVVVNSLDAALAAALAGAGIARVMSYQVDDLVDAHKLVPLLEGFEPAPLPANLIYPGQRCVPQKLRAFLDFAVPRLRERLAKHASLPLCAGLRPQSD